MSRLYSKLPPFSKPFSLHISFNVPVSNVNCCISCIVNKQNLGEIQSVTLNTILAGTWYPGSHLLGPLFALISISLLMCSNTWFLPFFGSSLSYHENMYIVLICKVTSNSPMWWSNESSEFSKVFALNNVEFELFLKINRMIDPKISQKIFIGCSGAIINLGQSPWFTCLRLQCITTIVFILHYVLPKHPQAWDAGG